jgi:RNA polymerase sigma factor (sigma-70 family)
MPFAVVLGARHLVRAGPLAHPPGMSPARSDPPLPERSRDAVLGDLHRRFRLPLLAYFGRRVANPAEAEDLTQDVFERVVRTLESAPIRNADSYVFKIAINLLRDRARSVRRRGVEEPLPSDAVAEFADALAVELSPERVVLAESALEEVLAALGELPQRTRAMLYMYRFENLKIREIAEMYAISPSAVEKQVAKALVHLTHRLQRI